MSVSSRVAPARTHRSRRPGRILSVSLALGAAAALTGCGPAADESACSGLSARTLAMEREVYSPCAGEMLALLDTLRRHLEDVVVRSDSSALGEARRVHRHLRARVRQVDFHADALREVRGGATTRVERWPHGDMRIFNASVIGAMAQYGSAVETPNRGNLDHGRREHAAARSAYLRFRR